MPNKKMKNSKNDTLFRKIKNVCKNLCGTVDCCKDGQCSIKIPKNGQQLIILKGEKFRDKLSGNRTLRNELLQNNILKNKLCSDDGYKICDCMVFVNNNKVFLIELKKSGNNGSQALEQLKNGFDIIVDLAKGCKRIDIRTIFVHDGDIRSYTVKKRMQEKFICGGYSSRPYRKKCGCSIDVKRYADDQK